MLHSEISDRDAQDEDAEVALELPVKSSDAVSASGFSRPFIFVDLVLFRSILKEMALFKKALRTARTQLQVSIAKISSMIEKIAQNTYYIIQLCQKNM